MPRDIKKFFSKIKKELQKVLGDNLYGIYIFGSLTYGGFRSKSSDIDCVAVINKKLNNQEFESLDNWYKRLLKKNYHLAKRLEMTYAVKNHLISSGVSKTPKFYNGKFSKKAESDANNPIVWLNIKNNGIAVFGPLPQKFVPNISYQILKDALKTESDYLRNHNEKYLKEDWSKIYVILTLCRILYTLKTKKIASKKEAVAWCLKNLPKKYHVLVSSAAKALPKAVSWKNLRHPAHGINEHHREEIILFEKYISKQLND